MEFRLAYPSSSRLRETAAAVIASMLEQIGISAELVPSDFPTFRVTQNTGSFDAAIGSWFVQPSPAGIPSLWGSGGIGNQNHGGYSNPKVDSLFTLASNEDDPTQERAYWREAFEELNRDPAAVWLYQPVNYAAIHKRFENVTIRPDRWGATMWQWRVRDGEWLPRDIELLR